MKKASRETFNVEQNYKLSTMRNVKYMGLSITQNLNIQLLNGLTKDLVFLEDS